MDEKLKRYFNDFRYVGGGRVGLPRGGLGERGVKTLRDLLAYIGKNCNSIPNKFKNYILDSLSIAEALPVSWSPKTRPNSIREKFVKKGLRAILDY